MSAIVVGSKMRFVPRRNAEYRCSACGKEIWDDSFEAAAGSIVTVTRISSDLMVHNTPETGCGETAVSGIGMYDIVTGDGERAGVPWPWLQPEDAPYDALAAVQP